MAGFEVNPCALRASVPKFRDSSDHLAEAAALLHSVSLRADALGAGPGAAVFAGALGRFTERHGADLRNGSMWVNDAGDALRRVADTYDHIDADIAALLNRAG